MTFCGRRATFRRPAVSEKDYPAYGIENKPAVAHTATAPADLVHHNVNVNVKGAFDLEMYNGYVAARQTDQEDEGGEGERRARPIAAGHLIQVNIPHHKEGGFY